MIHRGAYGVLGDGQGWLHPWPVGASSVTVCVAHGLFIKTSANALNHSESKTIDPRFGATLSLTGLNGLTTSWKVDDFGRVRRELRATLLPRSTRIAPWPAPAWTSVPMAAPRAVTRWGARCPLQMKPLPTPSRSCTPNPGIAVLVNGLLELARRAMGDPSDALRGQL